MRCLAGTFRVRLVAGTQGSPGLEAFRGAAISVIPAPLPPRTPSGEALRVLKAMWRRVPYVFYARHDRAAVRAALQRAIHDERPAVGYLDHLDSVLFAGAFRGALVVVDLHNVYSLLVRRAANEHPRAPARFYLRRQASLLDKVQRRAAKLADVVMAVSEQEAAHFRTLGARHVVVVPNGVDCAAYADLPEGRRTPDAPIVLFVGGLGWSPNVTAVRLLANAIVPEVRRSFPGARLRVVGRAPGPIANELGTLEWVDILGNVPDVRPHLAAASVLGVALEAGGGTRLKVLEAFAAGLPVVSTPVGCEGIMAEHGRHLLVADRPSFAAAIAGLLGSPEAGARLAHEARALAWTMYDWDVIGARAAEVISTALREKDDDR
jgi:glycosyltransferase involved in cell wall biosynthesis